MDKWQRILYTPNRPLGKNGTYITACKEHRELSKEAAKAGMVLLKNENNLLPLQKGSKVSLFGKASFDYVKGGGGSGDVTVSYITNLIDGVNQLKGNITSFEELNDFYRECVTDQYNKGHVPGLTIEPEVPEELFLRARSYTDTAIISFCRFSGEGWDRKASSEDMEIHAEPWVEKIAKQSNEIFEIGDFYLSNAEKRLVERVKSSFPKVIINMNVGGVVDSEWFIDDPEISSVMFSWQGGMEGGRATAELICGIGNPSGKLTDTYAKELSDYHSTANFHESKEYVNYTDDIYVGYRYFETVPGKMERVNYPFGFGLSYTDFDYKILSVSEEDGEITFRVQLLNIGNYSGQEVLQLYSMAPQGLLGKPVKELKAFKKSRVLNVGEMEILSLSINISDLTSYDDLGKIKKSAYVLEKGEYQFFLGNSIRDGEVLDYTYSVEENRVVEQLKERLTPTALPKRLLADGSYEELPQGESNAPNFSELDSFDPRVLDGMAPQTRFVDNYMVNHVEQAVTLEQVWEGSRSLEDFMDHLGDDDLIHLLGGQPNTGVANTFGWGNIPQLGIPNVMTADGPAGLRVDKKCGVNTTAWPCATLLASTWDDKLLFSVGEAGAKEVKENNLGVWLTPALNIHRSPLCGRNFEYFSEDPLISGKSATAIVRGIQSQHIAATIKHFAFNNKETNRKDSDSRISERAAREIYLKGFEIVVKEAKPWALMSAYNMINGFRTSECRELLEDILRGEWGYEGVVTTDWWTYAEHYKEVKAGNDIKMANGHPERLKEALNRGLITRNELEISAKRVLELIMKI